MPETLIALGANLSNRSEVLQEAIDLIVSRPGVRLLGMSDVLETQPIGVSDSDAMFLNAAARFDVQLPPREWLQHLLDTEIELGRERTIRWGARKIDLDLLLYGNQIIISQPLWVPHPRMAFRRFVMQPAVQIAGDMFHPGCGATLAEVWQALNGQPNFVVWLLDKLEHGQSITSQSFEPEVHCEVVTEATDLRTTVAEGFARLENESVLGGPPSAFVLMLPSESSAASLKTVLRNQNRRPKLVIRHAFSTPWFGQVSDGLDAPPRIELQLDNDDPKRIRQEVVGAIESMLAL